MKGEVNGVWPRGTAAAQCIVELAAQLPEAEAPLGARTRVWARLDGQRRSPARWLGWATAVTAAAALALLGVRLWPRSLVGQQLGGAEARAYELRGARVVIAAGGDVTLVEDDARGMVFSVERGAITAEVEHRPSGAPFLVRTPSAQVKVVGTALWVDFADGATTVEVAHGEVEVTQDARAVRVRGGERWPSSSSRSPSREDLDLLGSSGPLFARVAPPTVTLSTPFVVRPQRAAAPAPCNTLDGDRQLACLQHLAEAGDALHAELALYEIGWRARERGDARSALAAWERQRARFPSGVLRAEADASIIEALLNLGERERADRAIDDYLAAHPNGLYAPELRKLRH